MYHNDLVVNVCKGTAIDKNGFNISHPVPPIEKKPAPPTLQESLTRTTGHCKELLEELCTVCEKRKPALDAGCEQVKPFDVVSVVWLHIEQLSVRTQLDLLATDVKNTYADVFKLIPHVAEMLDTITK